MDFSEILRIASENQGCKTKQFPEKRGINTNLGKAKRNVEDKKAKGVKSAAVQAFLKKQEEEEKKQAEEAKKKKDNLMKLREEKNTVGKLRNIIKRNHTKEAIFEVEGTDKKGEKETTPKSQHTDQQINGKIEYTKLKCQYGGKERRALFQNIVRKPVAGQWTPKEELSVESSDKDGGGEARSAEPSKKKESGGDSKKGHSSKSGSSKEARSDHHQSSERSKQIMESEAKEKEKQLKEAAEKERKKKKKKPQGPPPMSFDDILKIAQQKKDGVPVSNGIKKAGDKKDPDNKNNNKKPKAPNRPMTAEEKERWERVNSKEYQDWIKHGKKRPEFCVNVKRKKSKFNTSPGGGGSKNGSGTSAISDEFIACSDGESCEEDCDNDDGVKTNPNNKGAIKQSQSSNPSLSQKGQNTSSSGGRVSKESLSRSQGKPSSSVPKEGSSKVSSGGSSNNPKALKLKGGPDLVNGSKNNASKKQLGVSESASKKQSSSIKNSSSSQGAEKKSKYNAVHENVLVCGSSAKSDNKPKGHIRHEMSAWDQVYGQFQKKKKKSGSEKKRRVIESDDEYSDGLDDFVVDDEEDDDMDGFIDDSGPMDYSKHIRDIFGYDKKKYQYIDEGDSDDMEAGFNEIEQEEEESAKIGMQEDLLDMKMEEEHKKRKMAMKKMDAKRMKYR